MIAAQGGQHEIVRFMIQACPTVDINYQNTLGFTALMRASDKVVLQVVLALQCMPQYMPLCCRRCELRLASGCRRRYFST